MISQLNAKTLYSIKDKKIIKGKKIINFRNMTFTVIIESHPHQLNTLKKSLLTLIKKIQNNKITS